MNLSADGAFVSVFSAVDAGIRWSPLISVVILAAASIVKILYIAVPWLVACLAIAVLNDFPMSPDGNPP